MLDFFPRFYASSVDFEEMRAGFPTFDRAQLNDLFLAAQLSVNAALAHVCSRIAVEGVADTFLSSNLQLFEHKDYMLFNVTVQLDCGCGIHSSCTILFKYGQDGVSVC